MRAPAVRAEHLSASEHYPDEDMNEPTKRLFLVHPMAPTAHDAATSLEDRPDDDLMLLARGGVAAAFDTLVRRHQHKVLCVAGRLVGRPSVARDIAQNVFLEIYRALPRYQARGKFVPYLNRVVLNQCRMVFRSARVERSVLESVAQTPIQEGRLAEAEIIARERQREVECALLRLSQKLRDVVVLRYSGELAYEEIAETLGVPVGTVKRRLFDAMEKLRQTMEES